MASKLSLLLAELKRRKVGRVAVVYVLVGLGAIEAVDIIGSRLLFPDWAIQFVIVLVLVGFPIALVLAWALEVTPQGIQKTADLTPEQLAAQEPTKWRASTWVLTGIGLVAILAAGYYVIFRGGDGGVPDVSDYRVAVLPLDNLTGDSSLDGVGETASHWITEGLFQTGMVVVVPFNEVLYSSRAETASGETAPVLSLTWPEETGANTAVQGSFSFVGDSIEYRLRIVDEEGTVMRLVEPVIGARRDPREAFGRLQTGVMGAIAGIVRPDHPMAFSALGQRPPNPDAHRAYLDGWRLMGINDNAALAGLQRSLEIDPDYLDPLIGTAAILHRRGRWVEKDSVCQAVGNRSEEMNEYQRFSSQLICSTHPLDVHGAARRLARIDPSHNYMAVLSAVYANHPREALEICSRYNLSENRYWRNWAQSYWSHCSTAHHMLGEHEAEYDLLVKHHPTSAIIRLAVPRALMALGRFDEADQVIEERIATRGPDRNPRSILNSAALEYDSYGEYEKASVLWNRILEWLEAQSQDELETVAARRSWAETLLYLGRDAEALGLLEDLVQEDPDSYRDLGWLGVARAKLGDRPGAEEVSEILLSLKIPFVEGRITARRAGIAAHLGDLDEAVGLMEQAIDEGWRQNSVNPYTEQYLKPLRGYAPFELLMEPKG